MRVKARFFAIYREIVGEGQLQLDITDPTPLSVWQLVVQRHSVLAQHKPAVAVNGEFAESDRKLKDGDEVAFLPPFSGGEPGARLTDERLDSQGIARLLVTESHGALVVFEGVVRAWSEGRRVLHLEYEAFEPMALAKMEGICEEMKARWGVAVTMPHRLGRMGIGEVSLVVAVASPHRKEAFVACQYAVDRIKEIVPIWKKEVFVDGEAWVGHQE